jgi:hypothetical protein
MANIQNQGGRCDKLNTSFSEHRKKVMVAIPAKMKI